MSVEVAKTIADLRPTLPDSSDPVYEGDDHIRLIKAALQATFLNIKDPITVFSENINESLTGYDGSKGTIEDRLSNLEGTDALPAPKGTKLLFYQPVPPTGWVVDTSVNEKVLKVSTALAGSMTGSGGTTFSVTPTITVADHTLTSSEMPQHRHGIEWRQEGTTNTTLESTPAGDWSKAAPEISGHGGGRGFQGSGLQFASMRISNAGGNSGHNHNASSTAVDWSPSYASVIVGVKA